MPAEPERKPDRREWYGVHPRTGCRWTVRHGSALTVLSRLPARWADCIVTSPPYWCQRDYGTHGQIGTEETIDGYVGAISDVMDAMARVLRSDGTLWLALGDTSYVGRGAKADRCDKHPKRRFTLTRPTDRAGGLGRGIQRKSLLGMPFRVALVAIERGMVWRSTIWWRTANRMTSRRHEAPPDRPATTVEPLLLFARQRHYHFDRSGLDAPGIDDDVWTLSNSGARTPLPTAPFPSALAERAIRCGSRTGGIILDPFGGTGTTAAAANALGRHAMTSDIARTLCEHMAARLRHPDASPDANA